MSEFSSKNEMEKMVMEQSYDRPMGVSLLAALLVLGGGVLLVMQFFAFQRLNETSSELGISNYLLQGGIAFLGLVGVIAGVGMWLGKKWGWWLALFYFAYAVCRNVNVLITIPSIMSEYGGTAQDAGTNYAKYGIRTLWNGFLLYYLFRDSVTTYFQTTETKKWKALLIVFAVCVCLFIVGALLG